MLKKELEKHNKKLREQVRYLLGQHWEDTKEIEYQTIMGWCEVFLVLSFLFILGLQNTLVYSSTFIYNFFGMMMFLFIMISVFLYIKAIKLKIKYKK